MSDTTTAATPPAGVPALPPQRLPHRPRRFQADTRTALPPDTPTPNYGWTEPQVGGSVSTWGTKLNQNFNDIDTTVFAHTQGLQRAASSGALEYLALTRDTASANGAFVEYNGPVGSRFLVGIDGTAEGGGNTASDYYIHRYDNSGNYLGAALIITRATGAVTLSGALSVAGALTCNGLTNNSGVLVANSQGGNAAVDLERYGTLIGQLYADTSNQVVLTNSQTGTYVNLGNDSNVYVNGTLHPYGRIQNGGDILCGTLLYPSYSTSGGNWVLGEGGGNRFNSWSPGWYDGWNTSNGTRTWATPSGNNMILDGSANLSASGFGSFSGAVSSGGIIRSSGARVVAQGGSGSNPSVACFNTVGYASAMFCDNAGTMAFGDADGNGAPQNYRATIDRSSNFHSYGGVSAVGEVYGNDVKTGTRYYGGDFNNAALLNDTNGHGWGFRWDGSWGFFRIDGGGFEGQIVTGNARNLNFGTGGGPTGWVLYGLNTGGTQMAILVSVVSDERIKQNIRPSQVDALQIINAIPIEEFEIKASVAGWFQGSDEQSSEERARLMREAEPEHVPIGIVAQKLQALVPEAVIVSPQADHPDDSPLPPNMLSLNEAKLVPYLLRALQQLTERVQLLEARA